jgi:hypothetical protein
VAPKRQSDPATSTATATTTATAATGTGLAARIEKIETKIDALIGSLHKDAGATTNERLDAPNSVAEEVQAELSRRDKAAKEKEAAERLGKVEEVVGTLTEKAPDPVIRKVEKFMGWRNAG